MSEAPADRTVGASVRGAFSAERHADLDCLSSRQWWRRTLSLMPDEDNESDDDDQAADDYYDE